MMNFLIGGLRMDYQVENAKSFHGCCLQTKLLKVIQ